MKRSTELICGAAIVLFLVSAAGWMLCLSKLNTDFTAMHIQFVFLALYALAAYGVNCLLMRRGVALQLYAAAQLVMIAGAVFVFIKSVSLEPFVLRTMLINCIMFSLVIPISGFVAYEAPKPSSLQLIFDVGASLTVIMLLLANFIDLPAAGPTAVLGIAALLLTLLALISERAGRFHAGQESVKGSGISGKLLIGVIFAAVVGLTAVIAAVASVGIRKFSAALVAALSWTWHLIVSILKWTYHVIEAFLLWLSQFFRPEAVEVLPDAAMAPTQNVEIEQMETVLPPWVTWAGIAIGVVLLALLFWKLRKHKFSRVQKVIIRKPTMARRENNASAAFRDLLRRLSAAMRFRMHCILKRNTAPGLLVWCERRAPKAEARKIGESGEAFLRRLAELPGCAVLLELAKLVETSFYAPQSPNVPRELCRAIRKIKFS